MMKGPFVQIILRNPPNTEHFNHQNSSMNKGQWWVLSSIKIQLNTYIIKCSLANLMNQTSKGLLETSVLEGKKVLLTLIK